MTREAALLERCRVLGCSSYSGGAGGGGNGSTGGGVKGGFNDDVGELSRPLSSSCSEVTTDSGDGLLLIGERDTPGITTRGPTPGTRSLTPSLLTLVRVAGAATTLCPFTTTSVKSSNSSPSKSSHSARSSISFAKSSATRHASSLSACSCSSCSFNDAISRVRRAKLALSFRSATDSAEVECASRNIRNSASWADVRRMDSVFSSWEAERAERFDRTCEA